MFSLTYFSIFLHYCNNKNKRKIQKNNAIWWSQLYVQAITSKDINIIIFVQVHFPLRNVKHKLLRHAEKPCLCHKTTQQWHTTRCYSQLPVICLFEARMQEFTNKRKWRKKIAARWSKCLHLWVESNKRGQLVWMWALSLFQYKNNNNKKKHKN